MKQAGFLNVYWKTNAPGVNSEEGLLGVKADPDFAKIILYTCSIQLPILL